MNGKLFHKIITGQDYKATVFLQSRLQINITSQYIIVTVEPRQKLNQNLKFIFRVSLFCNVLLTVTYFSNSQ